MAILPLCPENFDVGRAGSVRPFICAEPVLTFTLKPLSQGACKPICPRRPGLRGSRQTVAGARRHRPFSPPRGSHAAAPIACVCSWAEVSLSACVSSLCGSRPHFVPAWLPLGRKSRRPRAWVPQPGAGRFVSAACVFTFQGAMYCGGFGRQRHAGRPLSVSNYISV